MNEVDERRPEVFELSPNALAAYAGRFYQEDLGSVYDVRVGENGLSCFPPTRPNLVPVGENAFASENGLVVRFSLAADGDVAGFVVDAPRIRGIRISREDDYLSRQRAVGRTYKVSFRDERCARANGPALL